MSTIHPFTRAGFGPAPFRCTAVTVEKYQACHGAPIQPGTSCDYCGTGIMYAYWIENADSSRRFKVGCDCVTKTNAEVTGFKQVRAKLTAEQRAARTKVAREERAAKREAEHAERQKVWAQERETKLTAFLATDEGAKVAQFLLNADKGFLGEMNASLHKWGSLTDGQLKAVLKIMADDASKASSVHVGVIGERIEGTYTIARRTERDYGFPAGVRYWHLLKGADGNLYTYFGSCLGREGVVVKMRATVKAHEDYQGTKQTALARPSNIETKG
jgi:hypothetical protein